LETQVESRPLGFSSLPRQQVMVTFGGVLLAMFLGAVSQTVIGPAMPKIISDLGGFSRYTWVAIAHTVASAVTIPIIGKLTDMYGRKYFYIGGIAIYTTASLLSGLSTTMNQLITFRAIAGIGSGAMMSNAITVIGDLFPPAERGKYQGFTSGVYGVSSVLGPTLGGFLTDALSWRWVFFFSVPLGLLVIIVFVFVFPHVRPDNLKHRIDYLGLSTLVLAVVSLMLALSLARVQYSWNSPQILGMLGFAALMLVVFVMIERRAEEPILPLWLFRNPIISVSAVVVFVTGLGMFGSLIFLPLFFQGVLGVTATVSGSFMIPMHLALIAGSFTSGQLLSRAGGHYRIQGIIGIVIMGAGMALLARMGTDTQYSTALINIALTGFGLGITMPLYTIAVQNAVPYNLMGVATSSTMFFRSIGGSVGLAMLGSVMSSRFSAELTARLPAAIKGVISPQVINSLANNPQVLVSAEAQARLQTIFSQMGSAGSALYEQTFQALRQSLSSAISEAFLVSVAIMAIAFVANFFLKEIPLRKEHSLEVSLPEKRQKKN
jgi:EmrB/QacA subfamily drug resistance transporter